MLTFIKVMLILVFVVPIIAMSIYFVFAAEQMQAQEVKNGGKAEELHTRG